MKKFALLTVLTSSFLATPLAMAHNDHQHRDHRHQDYGRVTHVQPIYRSKVSHHHRDRCESARGHHDAAGGMILGGIAGSVIAGEIHGSTSSRIAGAVIGSAVGHDVASHQRGRKDCHQDHRRTVRYLDGYRVHYRYHGHRYVTHTDRHPGKRIRVTESVNRHRHHH